MSKVRITFETIDLVTAQELSTHSINIDGVEVVTKRHIAYRADYSTYIVEIILQVSGSIVIGLLSNWIYDQLKRKVSKLEINRRETIFSREGEVERILEEEIKVNE